jgi:hypothetical protein
LEIAFDLRDLISFNFIQGTEEEILLNLEILSPSQ